MPSSSWSPWSATVGKATGKHSPVTSPTSAPVVTFDHLVVPLTERLPQADCSALRNTHPHQDLSSGKSHDLPKGILRVAKRGFRRRLPAGRRTPPLPALSRGGITPPFPKQWGKRTPARALPKEASSETRLTGMLQGRAANGPQSPWRSHLLCGSMKQQAFSQRFLGEASLLRHAVSWSLNPWGPSVFGDEGAEEWPHTSQESSLREAEPHTARGRATALGDPVKNVQRGLDDAPGGSRAGAEESALAAARLFCSSPVRGTKKPRKMHVLPVARHREGCLSELRSCLQ